MKQPIYKKAIGINWKIEDGKNRKIRLKINEEGEEPFSETPWAVIHEDSPNSQVLVNHAIIMTPFESWGMVMDKQHTTDLTEWYKNPEIELHPDAWESYIEHGILNEKGEYIKKKKTASNEE